MPHTRRRRGAVVGIAVALLCGALVACSGAPDEAETPGRRTGPSEPSAPITLAFAGDVHFAGGLASVPGRPGSTLGPLAGRLADADLSVVNLESAVTTRTQPARKELEDPADRYWFRTPPAALDVLARSGVDVVSVANNHAADYGAAGLRDTLAAAAASPVAAVGAGLDEEQAFAPVRRSVRGVDVAVLAADASPRESADPTWSVGPGTGPGIARDPDRLLAAVREADARDDVVVVYLHWGEEGSACPTGDQQVLASALAAAGADVVVGTHAHVPSGAGAVGSTYVSYGLGNFFWYHGNTPQTGVLELTVEGGRVVDDEWAPGRIPRQGGAPRPVTGASAGTEQALWRGLRGCTDLASAPGERADDEEAGLAGFHAVARPVDSVLARRMVGRSHGEGCPVPLSDLRFLRMSYVGFDGRDRVGEMVVAASVVGDVTQAFAAMYAARFPIQQMRLVDDYDGDDDASMAANNTSAYNCRRVAGTTTWSDHAYGRAVDVNPVQNPYVVRGAARPPAGSSYVGVDRTGATFPGRGVVRDGAVVRRVFDRLGWTWGGDFSEPDYQHFAAPDR
ncbi:hypothetical protein GCM10011519_31670 [Marmoricola endophyticus]|uniref:Capsule synthesis protein CapA domain-containing protein n=1 Tax=Marmoricola endophyticus TaxID=2040280 RepID=A0A917BT82_9ACTN|nr:CapA family protein [Marmoricola endophyticus]GGF55451.1 hypothetical protein GCM10011519_31670 [Marmoricola endophyticus]